MSENKKLYTEKDLLDLLIFTECPNSLSHLKEIKSVLKMWLKKKNSRNE
jgi:DNA-binding transcriptional MerR regulator